MVSFQVSGGALRKCLRKRPSIMAKSTKVKGTSISAGLPFSSVYLSVQLIQSRSMSGLPSIEQHSSRLAPASGSKRNSG